MGKPSEYTDVLKGDYEKKLLWGRIKTYERTHSYKNVILSVVGASDNLRYDISFCSEGEFNYLYIISFIKLIKPKIRIRNVFNMTQ